MAEAKKAKLVKRIVIGPKPIHAEDAKGRRCKYEVGEEVMLTQNAANRFERYLSTPEIVEAQAKVQAEKEKAAAVEQEAKLKEQEDLQESKQKTTAPKQEEKKTTPGQGGGSKES